MGLFVGSFVGMADVGGLVGTTGLTQVLEMLGSSHSNPAQQLFLLTPGPFVALHSVVCAPSAAQDWRARRFRPPPPHPHSDRSPPMAHLVALLLEQ